MYNRRELIINKQYQRNPGVWPESAKTFFIDTILEGFPFPKIYLYQNYDKATRRPFKEIVDGQQRFTTIYEFHNNKFKLTNLSKNYSCMTFLDLDDDAKEKFVMYSVQVDIISAADKSYILELFRRMNSYTAPLNDSEKRHAQYQGEFKWFVSSLSEKYNRLFAEWGIFSPREIVRMKDIEFIADISTIIENKSLINKSHAALKNIYTKFDLFFPDRDYYSDVISSTLDAIFDFCELKDTFMIKDYALFSLFAAFAHLKYGILNDVDGFPKSIGKFYENREKTRDLLIKIAAAHENKEENGPFGNYVVASLNTTTKKTQRIARTLSIVNNILAL
jgi:hypothetical protein